MAKFQFHTIWQEAIRKYESDIGIKIDLSSSSLFARVDSPDAVLKLVDEEQKRFNEHCKSGEKVRDVLKPILQVVCSFAEAVGLGASLAFPPSTAIFGAVVVLLRAAEGVSSNYDSIIQILQDLDDFLDRFKVHLDHDITRPIKEMIVKVLAHLLTILGLVTKSVKENRVERYFKSLIGKNKDVQEALAKMDRLTRQENRVVTAVTLSVTNEILENLEKLTRSSVPQYISAEADMKEAFRMAIGQDIERIISASNQAAIDAVMNDNHRSDIHRWLSAPNPFENYHDALEKRQEGTGCWILEEDQFMAWKADAPSFLWIHGIPGCGKSVLWCALYVFEGWTSLTGIGSSTIIEDLERDCKADLSLAVAFFYFDFADPEKQRHQSLLSSLVTQFSSVCINSPLALERLYAESQKGRQRPTVAGLTATLRDILGLFRHAYVVLDAVDECTERERLLPFVEMLVGLKLANLHIMATSRPEMDIVKSFESRVSYKICLESALVDQDVRMYVRDVLHRDFDMWETEVQAEIEAALVDRGNGMFRWVYCQIDILRDCVNRRALTKALNDLPKTLDATYDRILNGIRSHHSEYAHRILQWLAFSLRPPTIRELGEVLAVNFDDELARFDPRDRPPDLRAVLGICSSLITTSSGDSNQTVQLAHFSVKEYLISGRIRTRSTSAFSVDERLAHAFISQTCLAYLLQFDKPDCVDASTPEHFPLADYAARFWVDHYRPCDNDSKLVAELFRSPNVKFRNWIRTFNPADPYQIPEWRFSQQNIPSPIYYASLLGLEDMVLLLLENGVDVKAQEGHYGYYQSALQAASSGGHEAIVHLLLENGADAHGQGFEYGYPLLAASSRDHEAVVRLLLENGADVNAQVGHYGNALQVASSRGCEAIVKLLLENGAAVNTQAGFHGNALKMASDGGHEAIVKLLLENGADVNAPGSYANALQAASFRGHSVVVHLLLENGADVNMQGGCYGNALQAASSGGHEATVKLLLENGADVNAQGGKNMDALCAASDGGHSTIVRLLLENGANVNVQGGFYRNALQAASNISVVRLLLENGADVHAQGGLFDNVLLAALSHGNEAIAQLLLEYGADVNTQEGYYGNVLQMAAFHGYEAVVRLLLENGADINAQGGFHGNALQAASFSGHEAIVKLLLENGADVNAQGGEYMDALCAASDGGCSTIVRLLLENGANVNNVQGDFYGSALQTASSRGYEVVVRLLLENGADINMQGGYYGSALQAASFRGHEPVVRLLLVNGADVHAQGDQFGDALHAALSGDHKNIMRLLLENGAELICREMGSAM
ncbi:hypothetical protein EW146_g8129 [Bondarzewia mesenterica]|uniref:Uncharacterized protein n=1 Tax=Bondarzewia mesenterica TaxID=1095465 RepID=A0A4S4LGV6_9AGAM|nr:hypothetical protein EW146_g8129 [Bondarzewia mesenterica]